MANRRMVNPKILLLLGAAVLLLTTAIAVFFAVGYKPDSGSGYRRAPAAPLTETSTVPFQPPPPPVILPPPMPQVPFMGRTEADGQSAETNPARP